MYNFQIQLIYSIQATSAASECVFSDVGLIMTAKRTSMKEDLFEALIFLKRNGGIVGRMFNLSKENYHSFQNGPIGKFNQYF